MEQDSKQSDSRHTRDVAARQTRQMQPDNYSYLDEEEYDGVWPSRMPTSARRYRGDVRTDPGRSGEDMRMTSSRRDYGNAHPERRTSSIPPRRTAEMPMGQTTSSLRRPPTTEFPVTQNGVGSRRRSTYTEDVPSRRGHEPTTERLPGKLRFHWLVYVGLVMIVVLVGLILINMFLSWWQVTQDDLHYGRPRTYQVDKVVGHDDSVAHPTHFIALNLNRHVQVLECPAGDCSKARVYTGPVLIGDGQDLSPVTLTFKDVNGDGKLDMIVNVQESRFVFINESGSFRPIHSGENVHI